MAYTVQVTVERDCSPSERGSWSLAVDTGDSFEYTFPLAGVDCPVTPYTAAAAIVPSR